MASVGKGLSAEEVNKKTEEKVVPCEWFGYKSSIKYSPTIIGTNSDEDIVTDIIIPAVVISAILEDSDPDSDMSDPVPDNNTGTIDSPVDSGSNYEASGGGCGD